MPEHGCETYDVPVKSGEFKKLAWVQTLTNTVVQKFFTEIHAQAEAEGTKAMAGETCKEPCGREVFIDIEYLSLECAHSPGPMHGFPGYKMAATVKWISGILCYEHEH